MGRRPKKIDFIELECPVCGRKFVPAPLHIYKRRVKGNMRFLCSWKCAAEYDKNKVDGRYARTPKSEQQAENNAPEGKGAGCEICQVERNKG